MEFENISHEGARVGYGFKFHCYPKKIFSYSMSEKWGICITQRQKVLDMNIAECTFMFGEWDIGFLVSISGECDMDFQDPFLESVI